MPDLDFVLFALSLTGSFIANRHKHSSHSDDSPPPPPPYPPPNDIDDDPYSLSPTGLTSTVHKFVLTGGPCGGKTTALARLSSYLKERGLCVYTVPEAATLLFSNGVSPENFGIEGWAKAMQGELMGIQVALEDSFEMVAKAAGKDSVLLCDRGAMDGRAYTGEEDWEGVRGSRGFTNDAEIREGRYNAVFHLVTAASGAEKYYTLENNQSRTEGIAEARTLDGKTQRAWLGHPQHFVFDNSTDFEGKLRKLVDAAGKLLGLPSLKRMTTKFLLREGLDFDDVITAIQGNVEYQVFDIEKCYLYENQGGSMGGLSPASSKGGSMSREGSPLPASSPRKTAGSPFNGFDGIGGGSGGGGGGGWCGGDGDDGGSNGNGDGAGG